MKIETIKTSHFNKKITVNNQEVIFKNKVAEVSDELAEYMLKNFKCFFEEGKVVIAKNEPIVHVFDQTMFEKQANDIVNLRNSLDGREKEIQRLKADLKSWKNKYDEQQDKFKIFSDADKDTETPVDTDLDLYKQLSSRSLVELKKMANELEIEESEVTGKKLKEDWIKTILKKSK
jgi:hypothetical protein